MSALDLLRRAGHAFDRACALFTTSFHAGDGGVVTADRYRQVVHYAGLANARAEQGRLAGSFVTVAGVRHGGRAWIESVQGLDAQLAHEAEDCGCSECSAAAAEAVASAVAIAASERGG